MIREIPKGFRSSPVLSGMFDRANRRYFRSSLPQLEIAWWKSPIRDWGTGRSFAAKFVVCEDDTAVIVIDPTLRDRKMWRYIESTLLHEMVHACLWHRGEFPAAYLGHGKKFQKEMLRLANKGAFSKLW
jgi:hypothetical protein